MEMSDYEIWACKDPEKLQRLAYEQQKEHFRVAEELVRARLFAAQKRPPLTVKASIAYYIAVKAKIGHLPAYWEEFRFVMKLMKSENFDLPYLLVRVNRLFQQFPDLLKGFEMYVPPSYVHVLYSESLRNRLEEAIGKLQPLEEQDQITEEVNTRQESKAGGEGTSSQPESHIPKPCTSSSMPSKSASVGNVSERKVFAECCHLRDDSVASIAKYGSLQGLQFFEKVKSALVHQEVYDNFMKCLNLFVKDILTRQELVECAKPFLGKFPELLKELRDLLKIPESGDYIEEVPQRIVNYKPVEPDLAMEIDYCCSKRECASYRQIPSMAHQGKTSGRTALCKEVINDSWVSFPTWSEESTCLPSVKTEYEESMYRIEDEQFELDMAIQANAYGIQMLENLLKKMAKVPEDEKSDFQLDDTFGGNSAVIIQRCLNRIYGHKTESLIDGLKRNPFVAVPIILSRLKLRERDWKEHQKKFNVLWKTQVQNIHPKALDVKGMNFRQVDSKNLRVKTLINEIETLFEEKKQKIQEGSVGRFPSPHMIIRLRDHNVFKDASDFVSQHIKRQPGIHKEDKREIEDLFLNFIIDIFGIDISGPIENDPGTKRNLRSSSAASKDTEEDDKSGKGDAGQSNANQSKDKKSAKWFVKTNLPYFLFFVNNSWYIFFRLIFVLINRLAILRRHSENLEKQKKAARDSVPADAESQYSIILSKIRLLLTNKMDPSTFEEEARSMFGTEAYVSYTFDKLVPQIIKQMHQLINDDVSQQCTKLCMKNIQDINLYEILSPYVLRKIETQYKNKAMEMMGDENCYRIIWYISEEVLTIELLDPHNKESLEDPVVAAKYSDYFDNYMNPDSTDTEIKIRPPFLQRNLVKVKKFWWNQVKQIMSENADSESDMDVGKKTSEKKSGEITGKKKLSGSHASGKLKKTKMLGGKPLEVEGKVKGGVDSKPNDTKKKQNVPKSRRTKNVNIQKVKKIKKASGLKRPQSGKSQQPTKKGRKEGTESASSNNNVPKTSQNVASKQLNVSTKSIDNNSKPTKSETGKNVQAQESDNEDSIEISADHLLLHLKETGMSICERYSDSFGSKSSSSPKLGSVENPKLHGSHSKGADIVSPLTTGAEGRRLVSDQGKSSAERGESKQLILEDSTDILANEISSICIAPDEQEVASLVEVTSSEQEPTPTSKTTPDEQFVASTSATADGQSQPEEVTDEGEYDLSQYSDEACFYLACEDMIIHEDTVAEIQRNSYKVVFAAGYGDLIYRRKSLLKAKKSHEKFSRQSNRKFAAFHKLWLDRYVTANMLKSCNLWMIRSDPDRYQVNCVTVNDSTKPPYGPYTKYFVRYFKRQRYHR